MRRVLLLLVFVVLLSVNLSVIFAQQSQPGQVLQVVDSDPIPGQELLPGMPITIYFDHPIECPQDQSFFSIDPPLAGEVSCADTTLVFTPAGSYESAASYTITLSTALRGRDGAQLLEEVKLSFNAQGSLAVAEVFPAAEAGIPADSVFTVVFNRPVVPLVTSDQMDTLPQPLTISPAVSGKGEWLNTSIYVFTPDVPLSGGRSFTATVGAGLTAVDGSSLPQDYTWTFSTASPEVIEISPLAQASNVPLDTKIQVLFNQPVDRANIEDNFGLALNVDADVPNVPGTFEWNEDNTGFTFTPSELLLLNQLYLISFAVDPADSLWFFYDFATVPPPSIIGTDPFDGQTGAPPFGGFTLFFASPMDETSFEGKFTIEPEPYLEPELFYRYWDDSLSVSFPTEPSTEYTVTVAPGIADEYGNLIDSEFRFSYTTDAYSPDVSLRVPGPVGFYNANREPTQLFLTHRNVERIDLSLYGINTADFVRTIAGEYYYDPAGNFQPRSDSLLRTWSVDSTAPENVLKYELLTLGGASSGGLSCPGSPPSRLKVGDTALVITDPDPLRARSNPQGGEIVELLYKNYALSIVGGPQCVDNLLWWEVQLRDEQRAWVAEGIGEEYFLESRVPDAVTPVTIPPVGDDGTLPPGAYYLSASSPETTAFGYFPQRHFLIVATASLTVKASVDQVTIWATDVQTGAPIPNELITLYDQAYNLIGTGRTTADGIAVIDTPRVPDLYVRRTAVLESDGQFGIGFTDWSVGIDPWYFGQSYEFYPRQFKVYVYSDRPIYRPGQPVYFRGVVRRQDDVTYTPAGMPTVPVQIFDDRGEVIYNENLPLTPFGTFSGEITLAEDAVLGFYRVAVDLPSETLYQYEGGGVSFQVAEFRLPEFVVEVTPNEPQVVQGDTVSITVDSKFFFGGPVSNAKVDYNVVADPYFFNYQGEGFYDFVDYNYDEGPGEFYGYSGGLIASGSAETDETGMFVIEVPAELKDVTQSQNFIIEAVVTDESQQAVAGRSTVIVHQGLVYIGARPESYVSTANTPANVELIAVDWESQPVANQQIELQVVERRWSSVQEQDEFGRTTWTWEVEEIPVTEGSAVTDSEGKAVFSFTPPTGGVYKVIVTSRDSAGNAIRSSTTLWVSSLEYVSWRQQNSMRIDLIADQDDYAIGDTAKILITSPFQGTAEALISVERGDVLSVERVTLDSNSYVYELPITEDFAPNVYVSAFIVKGVDEFNPVAAFRIGMVQLGVEIDRKEINIAINSDTERAAPRETVTYTVRTTDYKGDPVSAEVGVGVTDLASLSLIGPNSSPILTYFYGQQGLGVRTASPLTINTDELTQTTLDTVKGGGGGGGDFGVLEIRGDFVDTAYWNGSVVTDENGMATFEVTLPDNLTTWRLDARAVTSGTDGLTLVGENTFDLLSTKPLIIRPQTPRFFVIEDVVTLAAVINNNSGQELTINVKLEAEGVTLQGSAEVQTVTVADGGRARVTWDALVNETENVKLTFLATNDSGDFGDASISPVSLDDEGNLPVYRYEVPETVGTAGLLRGAGSRTESILLPRRFNVTQGELTIKVDQSLAATTLDGLDYLQNFPHQCIEQTVSRFLPNIMTFRALNNLGLADPTLESNLNFAVNFALQKLIAEQKADGGWGWFVQDASNAVTTSYALIGLKEAQLQGFPVSDSIINRAQDYLRTRFIMPGLNRQAWELNRQVFILYALARSGAPDIGRTVALYDSRERLSLYAQAWLAQTFHLIDPADRSRSDVLLTGLVNAAATSATGIHWQEAERDYWNWNTDTRTTAIILNTLILLRPDSELIPNVVRYLMVQRTADAWETTQETAWAVMALTDWMVASGELQPDYAYNASLNGQEVTTGTASSATVHESTVLQVQVADLLKNEANLLLFERGDGPGALYYTAHLRAFLPVPQIEALNRGIIIERRYTLLGDESKTPITQARVGDIVQVRLTVIVPNDLHYVVIEDPLPAGADAINPGLDISQQIGTRPSLDSNDPLSRGWGWWWFSNIEFRDEKVTLYSTYLPAGTYEYVYSIRPGFEGTYNVIPATGQEFYFPEVYGRSAGTTFTILPAENN